MTKEDRDFQKEVLEALAGLREDVDGLKRDAKDTEQRLMEFMNKMQKTVEGTEQEMRSEVKEYVLTGARSEVTVRKVAKSIENSMEATQRWMDSIDEMVSPVQDLTISNAEKLGKLGEMVEKISRAMKIQKNP